MTTPDPFDARTHVFAPRDGDRLDLGRAVVLTQI